MELSQNSKKATLYRMRTDEHICPFGIRSKDLLLHSGFEVEDIILHSRESIDQFKAKFEVKTTPQVFINGERVGGFEDLRKFLGKEKAKSETSYKPVLATFSVALFMALSISWSKSTELMSLSTLEGFVAISMCILAIFKLQDLEAFLNQFITYDLVAIKRPQYAYAYPFIEVLGGVAMLSGIMTKLISPLIFLVGFIGAISVFKAVYIDKRYLKCACVGGNSNVPLGFVSLTENLFMIGMGLWMFLKV